jgi:hypothetical protein
VFVGEREKECLWERGRKRFVGEREKERLGGMQR